MKARVETIAQDALPGIKRVVIDLCVKDKYPEAWALLDFYAPYMTTMQDYETIGSAALQAEHRELYMKCAERSYTMALDFDNEAIFNSRINLYKAYSALNQPEKALFYINLNLKMKPDDFDTQLNLAFNYSLLGEKDKADDMIEELIASNPEEEKNIKFALSGRMFRNGETAKAIINFIDTFKKNHGLFDDTLNMQKWTGTPQPGRMIYVSGEGGVGDELINIRFFKNLKALGMEPILYSTWAIYRPDIVKLFERHGIKVISDTYSIRRDALWTNLMPVPGYLGLNEDRLWTGPYLTPLRQEKNRLDSKKFKIGIKCNGNPYFSQDQYRSIPIEKMLQYVPEGAEVYYFDKVKTHPSCINLKDKLETWDDTLDYIDQMDVIFSSCTSLVHAAGAIGKRTIVATPLAEYYIWTSTRTNNTTPWYGDNMTVLKQITPRDWDVPLAKAGEILKDMMNG